MIDLNGEFELVRENPDLVYLDSASSSLVPNSVAKIVNDYYINQGVNIHRGLYQISQEAEIAFEDSRRLIASFIKAKKSETILTSGTTDGFNKLISILSINLLENDSVVIITQLDHNASYVPWSIMSQNFGFKLEVVPVDESGELNWDYLEFLKNKYQDRIRVLSATHMSNVTGKVLDLNKVQEILMDFDIFYVLDVAQSITHQLISVNKLKCDAMVFSGHKLYGPTGVGVLYLNEEYHHWHPFLSGGSSVTSTKNGNLTFNESPIRFEPGTPNVAGVIGLGRAVEFFYNNFDKKSLEDLSKYQYEELSKLDFINLYSANNSPIASFELKNAHSHDVGHLLAQANICTRSGQHCAMNYHESINTSSTTRSSIGLYNEKSDIDALVENLSLINDKFRNH